jgi:hypothetical protein
MTPGQPPPVQAAVDLLFRADTGHPGPDLPRRLKLERDGKGFSARRGAAVGPPRGLGARLSRDRFERA